MPAENLQGKNTAVGVSPEQENRGKKKKKTGLLEKNEQLAAWVKLST